MFDSSLDRVGTEESKIIRYVIADSNVFVISHKIDMLDKFNTVIEFIKKGVSICLVSLWLRVNYERD